MNNNRKRTLLLFSILVVMFFLFSIFFLNNKKDTSNEYNDLHIKRDDVINKIEHNLKDEDKVKEDTYKKVEKFVKAYHLISKDNNIERLNPVKNIIVDPLYLDLQENIKVEEEMPKNGYVYRTIEDMTIVDFKVIDDTSVMWTANAWSNWTDENGTLTDYNIMTKYKILLINDNGTWKIGQLSLENI